MALLDRQNLTNALTRLGELAAADGRVIELLVVGGAVMVLEFNARDSTRDLDGIVTNSIDPTDLRRYTKAVAIEKNWPEDWLNDGAKGFLAGAISPEDLFVSSGIRVSRPSFEQLLAMKLCAWRDDVDIADASRLLSEMPSNREQRGPSSNRFYCRVES